MSAKDNFAQAMKELLNASESDIVAPEQEEKKVSTSSFSSFSQAEKKEKPAEERKAPEFSTPENIAPPVVEEPVMPPLPRPEPVPAPAPSAAPAPAPMPEPEPEIVVSAPAPRPAPAPQRHTNVPEYRTPAAPMAKQPPAPAQNGVVETTVIAPGTTVMGDITTSGGLRIGGDVKGNLRVVSMMELNGKVIGDIEAADAVIVGSVIRGNVTISNSLTMDGDTTIVGDIIAKTLESDGKIKGNVSVEDRAHFQSSAVLVGNLTSGTIIIDEGAMLKGDISITSAQPEMTSDEVPSFDIADDII